MCCAAHKEEEGGAGADSELDESESEAEVAAEVKMTLDSYSYVTTAVMAPSGVRGFQRTQRGSSEEVEARPHAYSETLKMLYYNFFSSSRSDFILGYLTSCVQQEPEWDESSAFVAHAASHIRPKGSSRRSKENKENEARREVSGRAGVSIRKPNFGLFFLCVAAHYRRHTCVLMPSACLESELLWVITQLRHRDSWLMLYFYRQMGPNGKEVPLWLVSKRR